VAAEGGWMRRAGGGVSFSPFRATARGVVAAPRSAGAAGPVGPGNGASAEPSRPQAGRRQGADAPVPPWEGPVLSTADTGPGGEPRAERASRGTPAGEPNVPRIPHTDRRRRARALRVPGFLHTRPSPGREPPPRSGPREPGRRADGSALVGSRDTGSGRSAPERGPHLTPAARPGSIGSASAGPGRKPLCTTAGGPGPRQLLFDTP